MKPQYFILIPVFMAALGCDIKSSRTYSPNVPQQKYQRLEETVRRETPKNTLIPYQQHENSPYDANSGYKPPEYKPQENKQEFMETLGQIHQMPKSEYQNLEDTIKDTRKLIEALNPGASEDDIKKFGGNYKNFTLGLAWQLTRTSRKTPLSDFEIDYYVQAAEKIFSRDYPGRNFGKNFKDGLYVKALYELYLIESFFKSGDTKSAIMHLDDAINTLNIILKTSK